jgi:arsenate reductase (thioredoxin)
MAEGFVRRLYGDTIQVASAGVEKHGLDPRAVKVMAEVGVDIASQESKLIDELPDLLFDYVITLCDHAKESCPFFPGNAKFIHAGLSDPVALAKDTLDEEQKLMHYRRVRDEIAAYLKTLPEVLTEPIGK